MGAKIIHRIRPHYPRYVTQAFLRRLRTDFIEHRVNAKDRGIGFQLTFSQWLEIWIASGKVRKRGCRRGQYVMARYGDRGPYAIGNVKIISASENIAEALRGKPRSPETRALISLAMQMSWSLRRAAQRAGTPL
ncbi:hypothetical protein [Bradyrhizobium sp. WSM2793]|uniref:hypothetical protein n=1 Tax=Bradyrhizobium sp. WSM2793 TaxID=1038866 RepID=UPI00036ACC1C|nr:hypothetical protein [Bradyrhizobium sp. WSM2793]